MSRSRSVLKGRPCVMAVRVCILLAVFAVATVTAEGEQQSPKREGNDGKLILGSFLDQAVSRGIISEPQFLALHRMAVEMGGGKKEELKLRGTNSKMEGEGQKEAKEMNGWSGVFVSMYNRLTLLNVLYFSGALLTMGAYTLFTTVAWETYGFGGIGTFMLVQAAALGWLGLTLWTSVEYQFLGGILCSVSTTMMPFTVYSLERAFGWWPAGDPGMFQGFRDYVRGSWVTMELVTILTGLAYLSVVRFPFLLCPVAWMLWFLSMDLAPFFPDWYKGWQGIFEIRRQLSVVFGLGMMIVARIFEIKLGANPDFGFWFYIFGLLSFWCSVTFDFPEYDLRGSFYLLLNIALCLVGSRLNRTTFHVFSTMGIVAYTIGLCNNRIKMEGSFLIWFLKAFAAVGLFSQALRTGGNIEILAGVVCLIVFNFNAIRFMDSGEHYYLFLLASNLGFLSCVSSFQRPIDLWFFVFPNASWLLALLCSLSVGIFHLGLIKYTIFQDNQRVPIAYHTYRLCASVCLAIVFVFFRHPEYAWVGGLGIPLVAVNTSVLLRKVLIHSSGRPTARENGIIKVVTFLVLLLGITLSLYLETIILYFVCCVVLLVFVILQMNDWKFGGCLLAIFLILLSVPLQSKFLIAIGAIYIFFYLSHLAYNTFKDSILFSLTLIGVGLVIITLGYLYQTNEAAIQPVFEHFTPNAVKIILDRPLSRDWQAHGILDWYYTVSQSEFSFSSATAAPFNWLVWPGALTHALSKETIPYVSYLCAIGLVLLMLAQAFSKFKESLLHHLHQSVKVTHLSIALSRNPAHNGHGIVVQIQGRKPSHLTLPAHIALNIGGSGFWRAASNTFGEWKVGLAKSLFLPLKLTPHLISFTGFGRNHADFTATILLGTGHKGSAKFSHTTASRTLRQLKQNSSNVFLTSTLLYANTWYTPYSKLCEKEINLNNTDF